MAAAVLGMHIRSTFDGKGFGQAKSGVDGLKGNIDGLSGNFDKLNKGFKQAGSQIASDLIPGFSGLGSSAFAAGGAIAAVALAAVGLGKAIGAAASFEQELANLGAVSNGTKEQMEEMRAKAMEFGRDTQFSALESAQAFTELSKAGVDLEGIMNGAGAAAIALAGAGEIALPEAAAIASAAMNNFGLAAQELPHVADLIAGAANASAISVSDFGMSLSMVGAVANLTGTTFDDTALAITAMGNAGIKGSDAGTSLKTMLLNLQPHTEKAAALFQHLGLITAEGGNQFFDATGKVKSMAEISGVLGTALKDMTEQQKTATLAALFGTDAIRAAAVVAETGAAGFAELGVEMGKISAADVMEKKMDTLQGAITFLKGSVETAAIALGTGFQDGLQAMTLGLSDGVNALVPFGEAISNMVQGPLTYLGEVFRLVIDILAYALVPLTAATNAIGDLFKQSNAIGEAGIIAFLRLLSEKIREVTPLMTDVFGAAFAMILTPIRLLMDGIGGLIAMFSGWGGSVIEATDPMERLKETLLNIQVAFMTVTSFIEQGAGVLRETLAPVFSDLAVTVSEAWASIVARTQEFVGQTWEALQELPDRLRSLWEGASDGAFDLWDRIQGAWKSGTDTVISTTEGLQTRIRAAWDGVVAAATGAIDGFRETLQTWIEDHQGAVTSIIAVLALLTAPLWLPVVTIMAVKAAWDSNWGGIQDKAQEAKEKISETVAAMRDFLKSAFGVVQEDMKQTQATAIETGEGVGSAWDTARERVGQAATDLANWLISTWDNIRDSVSDAAIDLANTVMSVWARLSNFVSSLMTKLGNFIGRVWQAIRNAVVGFVSNMSKTVSDIFARLGNWVKDSFLGKLGELFSRGWKWIVEQAGNAVDALVSGFLDGMNAIGEIVATVMEKIGGFVTKIFGKIVEKIRNFIRPIAEAIGGVASTLMNALGGAGDAGEGLFATLAAGFRTGLATAKKWAVGIKDFFMARFKEIKAGLGDAFSGLGDTGAGDETAPGVAAIEELGKAEEAKIEKVKKVREKVAREARVREKAASKELEDALKEQARLIEENAKRLEDAERSIHASVMDMLDLERVRRKTIHAERMANLEFERSRLIEIHNKNMEHLDAELQGHKDQIEGMKANLETMDIALGRLKLDLNIEGEKEKLRGLNEAFRVATDKAKEFAGLFKDLGEVESDPVAARKAAMEQAKRHVEVTSEAQKKLLSQAMSQGLVPAQDQKVIKLLLAGYKQRASEVERILADITQRYQDQADAAGKTVDIQQGAIDAKDKIISQAERELALAKQLAEEETARIEKLIQGVEARITAENDRYALDMAAIGALIDAEKTRFDAEMSALDALVDREKERHEERLRQISEETALQLLGLGHTKEEVAAILAEQAAEAARQAAEAMRIYQTLIASMLPRAMGTGGGAAGSGIGVGGGTGGAGGIGGIVIGPGGGIALPGIGGGAVGPGGGDWSELVDPIGIIAKGISKLVDIAVEASRDDRQRGKETRVPNFTGRLGSGGYTYLKAKPVLLSGDLASTGMGFSLPDPNPGNTQNPPIIIQNLTIVAEDGDTFEGLIGGIPGIIRP